MADVIDAGLVALCSEVARVLPDDVVIECSSGEEADLFPAEAAATAAWEPPRRLQFQTSRLCAGRCMQRLGLDRAPILFDADGAPMWPAGVVGSISHKREHCVALVGLSRGCVGIGVDLERNVIDTAEAELVRRVCQTEAERHQAQRFADLADSPGTLFLTAKEAFFKYQFPMTRAWLDWGEVEVEMKGDTFLARGPGAKPADVGLFFISGTWMLSAYWRRYAAISSS